MNIAVSSIIIFLFLLPGIVFRKFYYTEEFSKQYFKENFFSVFISSFVPSILIHIFVPSIVNIAGYEVRLDFIGQILTTKDYPREAFENFQNHKGLVSVSFLITLLLGVVIGYFSKKVIRNFRWDMRYKLFRFKNVWHYIFSGEFFDFPRAAFDLLVDEIDNIDFV